MDRQAIPRGKSQEAAVQQRVHGIGGEVMTETELRNFALWYDRKAGITFCNLGRKYKVSTSRAVQIYSKLERQQRSVRMREYNSLAWMLDAIKEMADD